MRECAGRGGDGIVVALKDMLLQVLLAGSAVFLIPLFRLVLSKRAIAKWNMPELFIPVLL